MNVLEFLLVGAIALAVLQALVGWFFAGGIFRARISIRLIVGLLCGQTLTLIATASIYWHEQDTEVIQAGVGLGLIGLIYSAGALLAAENGFGHRLP